MILDRNKSKSIQRSLFDIGSDAGLIKKLLYMPKIDLHRHLTGSIELETAIKVAADYDVELPTYVHSDLENMLYSSRRVNNLKEYFSPWAILNKLFVSNEATHDIIIDVIRKAAQDNVIYVELRMGPHGFLGNGPIKFEEFIETVSASVAEAERMFGTVTKCILGIPRHVFGTIRSYTRNKMFGRIISTILSLGRNCFVGVDLNGDETAVSAEEFDIFFKIARGKGLKVTIHAGECGSASNVEYAVRKIKASRIGHGLAVVNDSHALDLLAESGCALEICPTSNEILGLVSETKELPLRIFQEYGVPFAICTDNPARCKTSLSQELFKVAKAFTFSVQEVKEIIYSSLQYSFADEETKSMVKSKLRQDDGELKKD